MIQTSSHAQLSDGELKRFLLHEHVLVRETVALYLFESWSPEDDLIPLVLEGCRRFGEEASFVTLGCARRFRWSTAALLDAIQELDRSHPPYLEELLARAPLSSIRSHEDLLRSVLPMASWNRIERRRAFSELPTSALWGRLVAAAHRADARGADRDEQQELDDLEEALASRELRHAVVEKIRELDRLGGYQLKSSLIGLAGAMNLEELAPSLIDYLGSGEDDLAAAAADALGRIGQPWIVERIREQYRNRPWDFRLFAIGALQPIKTDDAATTLGSLLETEDDPGLRGRIFDALRFYFTEAAAELIRDEIREPSSWMLDDELKKALWVSAQILERNDPEAEAWLFEDDGIARDGILYQIPVMDLGA